MKCADRAIHGQGYRAARQHWDRGLLYGERRAIRVHKRQSLVGVGLGALLDALARGAVYLAVDDAV